MSGTVCQHLLIDTGKPRKTCVEVAGRRTFRILTSSQQQSGIFMSASSRCLRQRATSGNGSVRMLWGGSEGEKRKKKIWRRRRKKKRALSRHTWVLYFSQPSSMHHPLSLLLHNVGDDPDDSNCNLKGSLVFCNSHLFVISYFLVSFL